MRGSLRNCSCRVPIPMAALVTAFPMLWRMVSMTSRRPWAKAWARASSACTLSVTSRKTVTPPRVPPGRVMGRPLELMWTPCGLAAVRMNISASSVASPRRARTRGSSSVGKGVTLSERKMLYSSVQRSGTASRLVPMMRRALGLKVRPPFSSATMTPSLMLSKMALITSISCCSSSMVLLTLISIELEACLRR